MIDWLRFVDLVGGHRRFLLVSHVRPDCDALGSQLALAGMLEQLGKDVWIVNGFAVPPNLQFLDPQRKLKQLGVDVQAGQLDSREVIVVLDTTAWVQLGAMAEVIRASKALKMVIDHHVSEDDLGAELFKDGEAEATGRLVLEAGEALGVRFTPEIAQPLFAAIATDTGWFRFASTGAETFRAAARQLEAGAQPDRLFKDLYETESLARLRLTGRTLARTQTELGGRLIYTWVERGDFEATGALPSDTEDLINMTLTVGGTEVALILVETKSGFKVSFRSRCELDCSRIAEQFGGGGHRRAAGAQLREPLATGREKVLAVVRAAMGQKRD